MKENPFLQRGQTFYSLILWRMEERPGSGVSRAERKRRDERCPISVITHPMELQLTVEIMCGVFYVGIEFDEIFV